MTSKANYFKIILYQLLAMEIPTTVLIISAVFSVSVPTSHSWNPNYDYYHYYDDEPYISPHMQQANSRIHFPNNQNPISPIPQCNCIKIKECPSLVLKLYAAPKPLSSSLMTDMRKKACGYAGIDPLVCCPNTEMHNFRRDVTTEKPWIWDANNKNANPVKPKQNNLASRLNIDQNGWDYYNFHRQNDVHNYGSKPPNRKNHLSGNDKKFYFFDFEDPRTFRNCPPSFSRDFQLPPHFEHVKPVKIFHTMHIPSDGMDPNVISNVIDSDKDDIEPNLIFSSTNEINRAVTRFPTVANIPSNKINLINSENCGVSINTRIIGGTDSGPGQFPWMARLAYRNKTSQLVSYRCSGSVIGNQYVLTAAHCVTNLVDELELIYVRLGELDSRTNLCKSGQSICSEPQDYEIETIVHHQQYDTPKYANDIALIRLRRVTNSSFISPLCLPVGAYANTDQNLSGKTGIIAGWGATTLGIVSSTPLLQWLRLPIVDTNTCADSYARFSANSRSPIIISNNQICVKGRPNQDACQGDSGGPLMRDDVNSGRYTLVGIVSFGPRTCGVSSFPGVYTRISSYIDWIIKNIRL